MRKFGKSIGRIPNEKTEAKILRLPMRVSDEW